jgi:hypothetical protein
MAKQRGPFYVTGRFGNVVFFKDADGEYHVQEAAGPSRDQLLYGKEFERSRENSAEFGRASDAGCVIRAGFAPIMRKGDRYMHSRLQGRLTHAIHADPVGKRGERQLTQAALDGLAGFEWNKAFPVFEGLQPLVTRTAQDVTVVIPPGAELLRRGGTVSLGVVRFDGSKTPATLVYDQAAVLPWQGCTLQCAVPVDGLYLIGLALSGPERGGMVLVG